MRKFVEIQCTRFNQKHDIKKPQRWFFFSYFSKALNLKWLFKLWPQINHIHSYSVLFWRDVAAWDRMNIQMNRIYIWTRQFTSSNIPVFLREKPNQTRKTMGNTVQLCSSNLSSRVSRFIIGKSKRKSLKCGLAKGERQARLVHSMFYI